MISLQLLSEVGASPHGVAKGWASESSHPMHTTDHGCASRPSELSSHADSEFHHMHNSSRQATSAGDLRKRSHWHRAHKPEPRLASPHASRRCSTQVALRRLALSSVGPSLPARSWGGLRVRGAGSVSAREGLSFVRVFGVGCGFRPRLGSPRRWHPSPWRPRICL